MSFSLQNLLSTNDKTHDNRRQMRFELLMDNAHGHGASVVSEEKRQQRLENRKRQLRRPPDSLFSVRPKLDFAPVTPLRVPPFPYNPSCPSSLPNKIFCSSVLPRTATCSQYQSSSATTSLTAPLPVSRPAVSNTPCRWDTTANGDVSLPSACKFKSFVADTPTLQSTFGLSECAKMTLKKPLRRNSFELDDNSSSVRVSNKPKQSTADLIQQALMDLDLSDSEDEDDMFDGNFGMN